MEASLPAFTTGNGLTVIECTEDCIPFPQAFVPYTVISPLIAPPMISTVILFVLAPPVIEKPEGKFQL